ncbi:MAG: hypothetical protein M3Z21_05095 [Pseudomonadota bacterium]|nr:hypothetical protein [Pseudomonadota bacterium]
MNDKTPLQGTILDRSPQELEPHVVRNAELVEAALSRGHLGLLRKLFPDEAERVVRAHELAELRTGFDYRRRALHMAVETRLQAVEEMCNHVLVTGKSEIRRQRQEFFAEQSLKLQSAMNAHAEQFNKELERRLGHLAGLRSEYLREKEEERLLKAVDRFHDMLEELAQEFVSIIHEGVDG